MMSLPGPPFTVLDLICKKQHALRKDYMLQKTRRTSPGSSSPKLAIILGVKDALNKCQRLSPQEALRNVAN